MKNLFDQKRDFRIEDRYGPDADIVLFPGDASALVASMPADAIDLIVTSPPYNVGKEYEKTKPLSHYLGEQETVISELHRVLADTGSICWQVGNYVHRGEVFPLRGFESFRNGG